jgi:hypothetical protein
MVSHKRNDLQALLAAESLRKNRIWIGDCLTDVDEIVGDDTEPLDDPMIAELQLRAGHVNHGASSRDSAKPDRPQQFVIELTNFFDRILQLSSHLNDTTRFFRTSCTSKPLSKLRMLRPLRA